MSTIWAFDHIENNHSLYRGEGCLKTFCESSREHVNNITDFEKKKKNAIVNKKRTRITSKCKSMLHLQKKIIKSLKKIKIIEKFEIIAIIQTNLEAQYIVYAI